MFAVTEIHGSPQNHGICHRLWFYRGYLTAVKIPMKALKKNPTKTSFWKKKAFLLKQND